MKKIYNKTDNSKVTITEEHYKNIQGLSEAEILKRAESDPDAQPLTNEQLSKFKRVNPFIGVLYQ